MVSGRVLRGLGINVAAPVEQYRRAYERFLPDAADAGIYPLLVRHACTVSADTELHWLADRLVIAAPDPGDQWWGRLWSAAAAALPPGCVAPPELDARSRLALLQHLLTERGAEALADGLAAAMRAQTGC